MMSASPTDLSIAEGFGFLTEASWAVETVTAAARLGVLDRLDSGRLTVDDLAAASGMTEHQARLLLISLARLGLAKTDEGAGFTSSAPGLSTFASRLLPRGHLTEVLAGKPPEVSADTSDGSTRLYPEMVRFLATGFRAAAAAAADHLSRPRLRVLDLGAGAAPWSLALTERDDTTRITAVDLPEVIPVTKSAVVEAGCSDRFDYLAGDLFVIDLGEERYDLVIAGGVCHLFDEAANRRLLEKAGRALAPGGTLGIMEPLPNERFDGPRSVLLYALNLTTRTTGGAVYPFSTYVTWLQAAGLGRLGRDDLTASPPISLITAHKPSSGGTT